MHRFTVPPQYTMHKRCVCAFLRRFIQSSQSSGSVHDAQDGFLEVLVELTPINGDRTSNQENKIGRLSTGKEKTALTILRFVNFCDLFVCCMLACLFVITSNFWHYWFLGPQHKNASTVLKGLRNLRRKRAGSF